MTNSTISENKSAHSGHRYMRLSDDDLEREVALIKEYVKSHPVKPAYNLITKEMCDSGILFPLQNFVGQTVDGLHLIPMHACTVYDFIYGHRKWDAGFLYLGEVNYYHTEEARQQAQSERNALEAKMLAAGKKIAHREIGAKSTMHQLHGHSSMLLRSLPMDILLGIEGTVNAYGERESEPFYGVDPAQSLYITPSAWRCPFHYSAGGKQRQKQDVIAHYAVVVDIDCDLLHQNVQKAHSKAFMAQLSEETKMLAKVLFGSEYGGLPVPEFIHDTGRGFQFWYVIKSIAVQAEPLYQRLIQAFIKTLTAVFSKYRDELHYFEFDSGVMTREATGWVRAFNTFNGAIQRKTQTYMTYTYFYGEDDSPPDRLLPTYYVRTTADELIDKLAASYERVTGSSLEAERPKEQVHEYTLEYLPDRKCPKCGGKLVVRTGYYGKFAACENYVSTGCDYTEPINPETDVLEKLKVECREKEHQAVFSSIFARRMAAIEWVIGHRQGKGNVTGWREVFMFQYYNAAVMAMDRSVAQQKAEKLNSQLARPLEASSLHDAISAVDKVPGQHYKYTEEKWLEALDLAPEELLHLKAMPRYSSDAWREEQRRKAREKKELRNASIEALRIDGEAYKDIAQKVGASARTVRRHLKQAGINKKELRDAGIRELYQQGKTYKQIATELGISLSTVKRALRSTDKPKA